MVVSPAPWGRRSSSGAQGLLEQLYLHGFRRLEDRLNSVPSDRQGRPELLAFALAYRAFALDNEALYGLMFERATPDFVPSDASSLAGLGTFEMLATRVADWRPDFNDPAAGCGVRERRALLGREPALRKLCFHANAHAPDAPDGFPHRLRHRGRVRLTKTQALRTAMPQTVRTESLRRRAR